MRDSLMRAVWTAVETGTAALSVDAVLAFDMGAVHIAVVAGASAGLTVVKQAILTASAERRARAEA